MLVYGTCNPEGYGDSNYEGLFLTDADIRDMTPQMTGLSGGTSILLPACNRHTSTRTNGHSENPDSNKQVCPSKLSIGEWTLGKLSLHGSTRRIGDFIRLEQGRMDVLMQIDDTHLEGAMGKEFITRGICAELSLGYHVTMSRSPAGFLKASNKKVVELSIVRQGARQGCKIRMFSAASTTQPTAATKNDRPTEESPVPNKKHRILI